MNNYHSQLKNFDIQGARVLLRADLNVPLEHGKILNDYRLQSLLPTIDYIIKQSGKIILMTHIGRPKQPTDSLSTSHLLPWFKDHGYAIELVKDFDEAYKKSFEKNNTILLLENLRFYPEEKKGDTSFAQKIARLGDYYVNDAFGALHRNDSSITLVPEFFKGKSTIGFLVEKELNALDKLIDQPKKPFVLILGGGKVADKLPLIQRLVVHADYILLCPAIVFTFLAAQGKEVGISLIDRTMFEETIKIMDEAKKQGVTIKFPIDYQVAIPNIDGQLSLVDADNFPKNGMGISIGPKTINDYAQIINNAHTIFFNAAMGFPDKPKTLEYTGELLKSIAHSSAFSVIGGGESVTIAQQFGLADSFDHVSTGGGATLTYLSGEQLPGLVALK